MMQIIPWNKKPIARQGIYSGVNMNFYHSPKCCIEPSISSGGLRKIFLKSPKHYWNVSPYNPKGQEEEETESMVFGRAAHHILFGQEEFRKEYELTPDLLGGEPFSLRKSAHRIWWKQQIERGKTPFKQEWLENVISIANAIKEEPLIKAGLLNGLIEHSWFWKDQETGIWLKIRPDASPNHSLDFADLKITNDIDWQSLQYTIRDQGYYIQAGLVAMACQAILGKPLNSFSLVFVEKKPPHVMVVVTLKENEIHRGIRACRLALRQFAHGIKTGEWPGPYRTQTDAQYIELREFDQKEIDMRLRAEGV